MPLSQSQILSIQHVQVVKLLDLASAVILVYDYLLTFKLELEYAWGRQWSVIDVLFFTTRYMPFVDIGISIYSQLIPGLDESTCSIIYQFTGWSFTVGMAIAEVILTVRTWTLWNRSRQLGLALSAFFVLCWTVIFALMGLFLASSHVLNIPVPEYASCFAEVGNIRLYICWCMLMVFDGGIMILMIVQAVAVYSDGRSSALLNVLYIDGISYYVFLYVLSVTNVVIILKLPSDFVNLFSSLERVLHSILTCRVVLHVREQASKNTTYSDSLIERNGGDVLRSDSPPTLPTFAPLEEIPIGTVRRRRMTMFV